METSIICWGNIGIMENKMETNIVYGGSHFLCEDVHPDCHQFWYDWAGSDLASCLGLGFGSQSRSPGAYQATVAEPS